jgi:ABC-type branched-subunit amino acid transport system ATPase component
VAIALATEPRLLLLDEPAAGLSHEESSRMMDLISDRVRGRCSVVLVEHNMRIVRRYCDRAVVLQFGRKIFDGAPADMVNERAVVDAYLGTGEGA